MVNAVWFCIACAASVQVAVTRWSIHHWWTYSSCYDMVCLWWHFDDVMVSSAPSLLSSSEMKRIALVSHVNVTFGCDVIILLLMLLIPRYMMFINQSLICHGDYHSMHHTGNHQHVVARMDCIDRSYHHCNRFNVSITPRPICLCGTRSYIYGISHFNTHVVASCFFCASCHSLVIILHHRILWSPPSY